MSKTYADALKYFRTKLKAGPEPVDLNLTTEDKVGPQVDHEPTSFVTQAGSATEPPDVRRVSTALERCEEEHLLDQPPESDQIPWAWGHLMSREEFLKRDPWRQKQLVAQWMENVALGGKHALTLRGGPKNKNCFRGCPSYECLCEETL
jgi:hypothetical protein